MVLPNFKENLEKYAKLLVANGINVQPGHTLVLNIDVEQRELAHLIVKEAYALGAHEVIVQWADDFTTREKFLHAPMDRLDNVPDYKIAEMNYLLEHKTSRLGVRSSDPGALNGVDAEKLSASAKALGITFFNTLFDENASNHLAIGAAYATSVEGGAEFTEEELEAAGLNRSDVHVDFMIGSSQMNIDGIREDGTRVPVFRNGDWAI